MPNAGWYDSNLGRAYPLVTETSPRTLPNRALADFGCLLGPTVSYDATEHRVYLYGVRRSDGHYLFEFRSTAPALSGYSLTFCRHPDDLRFAVSNAVAKTAVTNALDWLTLTGDEWAELDGDEWAELLGEATESVDSEDSEDSQDSEDDSCEQAPLWSGYLVTGDLTSLAELLPNNGDVLLLDTSHQVEPTLLRSLLGGFLSSVSVANAERTRVATPEGCRAPCYPFTLASHYVQARCLQGALRFREGYNLAITQNDNDNSLLFSARKGSGLGEPCDEVPLFAEESPPQGSTLLTGGPTCDETVRTINGIGKRLFELTGRAGVVVSQSIYPHQLIVRIDAHDLVIRDDSENSESSQESEQAEQADCPPSADDTDPCACGADDSETSE